MLYYFAQSADEARNMYEADRACSPSRVEWQETLDGIALECRVERAALGNYCGYVRVPLTKENVLALEDLQVHGGVTFNDGEWVGFDCAHVQDYTPNNRGGRCVWTLQAVQEETRLLARQIRARVAGTQS